jgi:hypothetical protein
MSPYEPPRTISVEEYHRLIGVAPATAPRRADLVSTPNAMNKTEARYSLYLEALRQAKEIQWFRFQPIKLRLADNTFWTPDFFSLTKTGNYLVVDVKGTMKGNKPLVKDDARVKIKIAARDFPMWTFQQAWYTKSGWQHKNFGSRF